MFFDKFNSAKYKNSFYNNLENEGYLGDWFKIHEYYYSIFEL